VLLGGLDEIKGYVFAELVYPRGRADEENESGWPLRAEIFEAMGGGKELLLGGDGDGRTHMAPSNEIPGRNLTAEWQEARLEPKKKRGES